MSLDKKSILLFETIKIEKSRVINLRFHKWRIEFSLTDFGSEIKFDLDKMIEAELAKFMSLNTLNLGILKAKLIYNALGEFEFCEISPYTLRNFHSFKLINIDFSYGKKLIDRSSIDRVFAKRQNCDEILMIKDGLLTDTSIANIAIFDGSKWLTPKYPLLKGTTRQRLLECGLLEEASISVDMLKFERKFAVMNAVMGFREIDGVKFEY